MAKKPTLPKNPTAKITKALSKRVNFGKGRLGRDVKVPKWLKAIGNYFSGAVVELRQVHWPNRKATWSFTVAVILFTATMSALILALDYGFEQLFKQVIL